MQTLALLPDVCFANYWPIALVFIAHNLMLLGLLRWLAEPGKWFLLSNLVAMLIYVLTSAFFYFNVQLDPSPNRVMALVSLSYILHPPFAFFIIGNYVVYCSRVFYRRVRKVKGKPARAR